MSKKIKEPFGEAFETPVGQLRWPSLGIATDFQENKDYKFKTLIVLKFDEKAKAIAKSINDLIELNFGKGSKAKSPIQTGLEYADGYEASDAEKEFLKDKIVLSANKKVDSPPTLYLADGSKFNRVAGSDQNAKEIEQEFYAGALAKVKLSPVAYHMSKDNFGVKLSLVAVMKVADGKRIGGVDSSMSTEVDASELAAFNMDNMPDSGDDLPV